MSKRKILLTLLLAVTALIGNADNYIKREVRSVWMTTVWNLDWPTQKGTSATVRASQQAEMIKYLDQLQADNFNAVYFQVRSMCDAFYKSSYEPWSSYLTNSRGANPGWDPLAFVVEECHKRGMECHAWVNPYRFSTGSNWTTAQDNELRNAGWLLSYTGSDGKTTTILNPGIPAAKERIVNVCREIVSNYDVDGIVFDDYFYPKGIPTTSSADDYTLWRNSGTSLSFGDWRRDNVNQMVADVYNMIQSVKPWAKFGISPAGVASTDRNVAAGHGVTPCPATSGDWQYNGIFSDPVAWLKAGTVDYISPQIYWTTYHSTAPFGPLTKWWSQVAKQFGRHHYASHSISFLTTNSETNWAEVAKQVQLSRDYTQNAAPGCVFYSNKMMSGRTAKGVAEYLLANKFQKRCLTPAIDWKATNDPGQIQNYAKSGSTLSWNAIPNMRYSVYAIPTGVSKANIMSNVTSGIVSDYLLGVTYTNSFTLPSGKTSGYYYAVCVLDRYGNEYAPFYSDGGTSPEPPTPPTPTPSEKVTLLSPTNGATVESPASFQWSAAANATYTLQISKSSTMGSIDAEYTNLSTNSKSVDLSSFGEGVTIYWRVICTQSGKEPTESAIASCKTATSSLPQLGKTTLTAPANGSKVADAATITFSWSKIRGKNISYKIEFATDANFNNMIISRSTTSTSTVVDMAEFKYNSTYYWRVIGMRNGYNPSTSSVWSFETPTRVPAPQTTLIAPANGKTMVGAFNFEFKDVAADGYKLEVASSADFSNIVLTKNSGWSAANGVIKYAIAENELKIGEYYWRVVTSKEGNPDSTSEAWTVNIDSKGSESAYVIKKDPANYSTINKIEFENLWVRSADSQYNNLPANTDAGFNRSFCVIDNIIYISGRVTNSSNSECYLSRFNAETGEFISKLNLSSNVQVRYLPCNDVMKDNAGNLLVANMSLNISADPIVIHKVDKFTGEAVQIASCKDEAGGRVDHCAVYGDVNSGNFYVFAGLSKSRNVVRWTFKNGACTNVTSSYLASLQPENSNLGISVRVFPKTDDLIYVNSSLCNPTLYKFSTGEMVGSFNNKTSIAPWAEYANGLTFFNYSKQDYMVYPGNPMTGNEIGGPYDFDVTMVGANQDYSTMNWMWTFPKDGLGSNYSPNADVLADHELHRNSYGWVDGVNIYIYVPLNGLAAYRLSTPIPSGVANELAETFNAIYSNGTVSMNATGNIEVYNTSGMLVESAENTDCLSLAGLNKGVYIVRCSNGKNQKTLKIVK